jgi:hypothetical protein
MRRANTIRLMQTTAFVLSCISLLVLLRTAWAYPLGRIIGRLVLRVGILLWLAYSAGRLLERIWNASGLLARKGYLSMQHALCKISATRQRDE